MLFESDTIIDDFDGSDNGECKQEDEECEYLEQCCLDGREGLATTCEKTCQFKTTQEDPFLAWEYPFCAVWSVNDSGWQPDMFAFAGFRPWPPIPWPLLSASTWLQEKMAKDGKVLSNNGCDKIVGFKLHQVPRLIGYYPGEIDAVPLTHRALFYSPSSHSKCFLLVRSKASALAPFLKQGKWLLELQQILKKLPFGMG